jgi:hypothetical protein
MVEGLESRVLKPIRGAELGAAAVVWSFGFVFEGHVGEQWNVFHFGFELAGVRTGYPFELEASFRIYVRQLLITCESAGDRNGRGGGGGWFSRPAFLWAHGNKHLLGRVVWDCSGNQEQIHVFIVLGGPTGAMEIGLPADLVAYLGARNLYDPVVDIFPATASHLAFRKALEGRGVHRAGIACRIAIGAIS